MPSHGKREAMGHSHTSPHPWTRVAKHSSNPQEEGEAGTIAFLPPSFWKKDGDGHNHTPSPLPYESGMRVTTMAPPLLKIRRAEATILHFSRGEGERSWSPSTLPSGRGRPWAIATPFLYLARDCRKLLHFQGREGSKDHSLLPSFLLEEEGHGP